MAQRKQDRLADFPRLLTPDQVLKLLGVQPAHSSGFLRCLRRRGVLCAVRVGRSYFYPEQSVRDFLTGKVA